MEKAILKKAQKSNSKILNTKLYQGGFKKDKGTLHYKTPHVEERQPAPVH